MKDTETLIIFDFDSLWYNKKHWKVVNPKIGALGSLKDFIWVMNFYKTNKDKETFDLFSYCIPEVEDIPSITQQQIENGSYNFFPLEKIKEVIMNHKLHRRKMIVLTLINSNYIKEIFFSLLSSEIQDSFDFVEWIEYWMDKDINIQNYEFPRLIRFLYIKNILKKKEEQEEEKIKNLLIPQYKKIYYYTTDPVMIQILKKHLLENPNLYEYKTNTIISYLIVKKIII